MEKSVKKDVLGSVFGLYGAPQFGDVVAEIEANKFKAWVNVNTADLPSDALSYLQDRNIQYVHIAIEVPTTTSYARAVELHHRLAELPKPIAIQCATSNRASAVLAIHYGLTKGLAGEQTLSWAKDQGLKCVGTPALRAWIHTSASPINTSALLGQGKSSGIIFRQLFEKTSSTYTYLLACPATREAVLIDPVAETSQRDLELLNGLGLTLVAAVNTHVHADHVSGTAALKSKVSGVKSMISAASEAKADVALRGNDKVTFGSRHLVVRPTPGHTDGCVTYVLDDKAMAFTGDALLVRGCGRTDFQQGSPDRLWDSVQGEILGPLPDECMLYPAHDYNGHHCTTVAEERALNPRLGMGRTKEEFKIIMDGLNLPRPAQIDKAVPANMHCGVPPPEPEPENTTGTEQK